MPLIVADRVQEITTTTGTGTLTLGGPAASFRSFGSVMANGDTAYYALSTDADFEVGLGTYSTGTLARTTIIASSNGGAAVNLPAGEKRVFLTAAARQIARVFTATVNLVAATALTVNHNLGLSAKDTLVVRTAISTGEEIQLKVISVNANSLTIESAVALTGVLVTVVGF